MYYYSVEFTKLLFTEILLLLFSLIQSFLKDFDVTCGDSR